ncbi:exosortase A [Pseudohaliea sp.]|uniref:exosortase A n=1 Tax=Pseudohaliea sp. TaxID=2740289 RepID=UPI0032EDB042
MHAEAVSERGVTGGLPASAPIPGGWRLTLGLLALAWLLLGTLFQETLGAMVHTWTVSSSYNHGFLILPISLWLAWRARARVLSHAPVAAATAVLPFVAGALLWLAGALVDVLVVQQVGLVAMLVAAAWGLVGTPASRELAFPLLFLFLAVPMGKGLEPPMMALTADWTVKLVRASGVPVYQEGLFFYLPTGSWSVVEACSGVRYIIASVTLGLLYGHLSYRSPWRRVIFVLAAIVTPIIANVLRAYGIVMLGHLSNMELATGVDHLIYGWIFFGLVMFFLFWIGSFWQEAGASAPPQRARDSAGTRAPAARVLIAGLTLGIAVGVQALGERLSASATVVTAELQAPDPADGWRRLDQPFTRWRPVAQAADRRLEASYAAEGPVTLVLRQVVAQTQGEKELVGYGNEWVADGSSWRVVSQRVLDYGLPGGGSVDERQLRARFGGERLLAWAWYHVNGETAVSPYRVKWLEVRRQLLGRPRVGTQLLLVTSMAEGEPAPARDRLKLFLRDHSASINAALAAGLGRADPGRQ